MESTGKGRQGGKTSEIVYVALGSNRGDREKAFIGALEAFAADPDLRLLCASRVFETPAVGPAGQGAYLNAVVELRVALEPVDLLERLHRIECVMGRDRSQETVRWGPRSLDLDILFFADRRIESSDLVIPHPRSHERDFVMIPMAEIAPEFPHPVLDQTMAGIARSMTESLRPYIWSSPERWPS